MKTIQVVLFLIGAMIGKVAFSQTIYLSPANESLYGVQLNTNMNAVNINMPMTGYGVATKKIGIVHVKLLVNQFFTQYPSKFQRNNNVLDSLKSVGLMGMRITLLRTLEHTQLQSFINDYIASNLSSSELKLYKNDMGHVLDAISSNDVLFYGESITFVLDSSTKIIHYQNTKGTVIPIYLENEAFIFKVMGIWFGNCTDSDCSSLKNSLISVPKVTAAN